MMALDDIQQRDCQTGLPHASSLTNTDSNGKDLFQHGNEDLE